MAREEAEIKELTKKLAQKPDSLVFAPLADAHRRLGQYEEAIRICHEGLEKNPAYMTARVILGRALMDTDALDEAATEFKKIEAADPQNIMAHSMTGQIAMRQEQYPVAIEDKGQLLIAYSVNKEDIECAIVPVKAIHP
jgi:tetratricopeptide (TPR) repeat protein